MIERPERGLGGYKASKRIRFTDQPMPRFSTGGVDRQKLPKLILAP